MKTEGTVTYLASLRADSGRGSHTPRPSSYGKRTHTAPWLSAHGETEGLANATAGSRSHEGDPSYETPVTSRPET